MSNANLETANEILRACGAFEANVPPVNIVVPQVKCRRCGGSGIVRLRSGAHGDCFQCQGRGTVSDGRSPEAKAADAAYVARSLVVLRARYRAVSLALAFAQEAAKGESWEAAAMVDELERRRDGIAREGKRLAA